MQTLWDGTAAVRTGARPPAVRIHDGVRIQAESPLAMTAASDMMRDGTGSQKWTVPPSPPSARMDLVEGEGHVWLASTGKA